MVDLSACAVRLHPIAQDRHGRSAFHSGKQAPVVCLLWGPGPEPDLTAPKAAGSSLVFKVVHRLRSYP
jgi:hypothetical protein